MNYFSNSTYKKISPVEQSLKFKKSKEIRNSNGRKRINYKKKEKLRKGFHSRVSDVFLSLTFNTHVLLFSPVLRLFFVNYVFGP